MFSRFSEAVCGYGPRSRAFNIALRLRNFANKPLPGPNFGSPPRFFGLCRPLSGEQAGDTDLGERPLAKISPDVEESAALLGAGLGGQVARLWCLRALEKVPGSWRTLEDLPPSLAEAVVFPAPPNPVVFQRGASDRPCRPASTLIPPRASPLRDGRKEELLLCEHKNAAVLVAKCAGLALSNICYLSQFCIIFAGEAKKSRYFAKAT